MARDAWEELKWQFVQELLDIDRRVLLTIRDESHTMERIWFFCNAPGADGYPWLQLPRTVQLDEPGGYFLSEIWDRRLEDVNRFCWKGGFSPAPRLTRARLCGPRVYPKARPDGEVELSRLERPVCGCTPPWPEEQ